MCFNDHQNIWGSPDNYACACRIYSKDAQSNQIKLFSVFSNKESSKTNFAHKKELDRYIEGTTYSGSRGGVRVFGKCKMRKGDQKPSMISSLLHLWLLNSLCNIAIRLSPTLDLESRQMFNSNQAFLLVQNLKLAPRFLHLESRPMFNSNQAFLLVQNLK